jgi:hypothetical protein
MESGLGRLNGTSAALSVHLKEASKRKDTPMLVMRSPGGS